MKNRTDRARDAFSLVELLVVIGIIGILITLVVPGVQQARARGMEAAAVSNTRSVGQAEALFRHDNRNHVSGAGEVQFRGRRGLPLWSLAPYLLHGGQTFDTITWNEVQSAWRPLYNPAVPPHLTWGPDTYRYAMAWNSEFRYDVRRRVDSDLNWNDWNVGGVRQIARSISPGFSHSGHHG